MSRSEVERIRTVYARRDSQLDAVRYTPFDPAHQLLHFSRQWALAQFLRRHGIHSLKGMRIMEVGCGACDILVELIGYGADPTYLFGIDILADELAQGQRRSAKLNLVNADGQYMPFRTGSFDFVVQYTVFTSILDMSVRKQLALEMQRVVKPGGLLALYDFWPDNPRNQDVKGFPLRQVKTLFSANRYDVQRIVLAPPIARRLAPISPLVCQLLERVPALCSHYLVGMKVVAPARLAQVKTLTVRRMTYDDVPQVVGIHLKSLPDFFLSFLGPRFLALFYEGLLADPDGAAWVACSNDQIEGFVSGVTHQSDFYRRLLQEDKWKFAYAALGALMRQPAIASRLLRTFKQPDYSQQSVAEACLMSVAVRPESEGKGCGQLLVRTFCQDLAERGIPAVCLTTDRDANERTNRFYQEFGFQLARSFITPEGRTMNEYVIPLKKKN